MRHDEDEFEKYGNAERQQEGVSKTPLSTIKEHWEFCSNGPSSYWFEQTEDGDGDAIGPDEVLERGAALEARLAVYDEPATCNRGHTSLPVKLWDCPVCTEELNKRIASLQAEVERFSLPDVLAEIARQDAKWGPNRTHPNEWWYPILGEEFGELGKAMLECHFDYQDANEGNIREELIHVVAVGLQWLNSMALLAQESET